MSRPSSRILTVFIAVVVLFCAKQTTAQSLTVSTTLSNYNGYSVSCHDSEDGAIDVTVSGGAAPYSFAWSTANGSTAADGATSEDLANLKAGTYTVIVSDSVGAADTLSVTLTSPSEMELDGMMVELPSGQYYSCDTCADGSGTLMVSGAVPPYSFAWPAGVNHTDTDTSTSVSTFTPETQYLLVITDANGCSVNDDVETPPYNVADPLELFGTLSSFAGGHQVSTHGGSNGWIDLQVVGGTAPYTYAWVTPTGSSQANGATTQDISSLAVGTYTVTVTDNENQQTEKSFTLNGPANPLSATLSVINPNCYNGNTGQLTASVSGGTPPYVYLWSTSNGSPHIVGSTVSFVNQLGSGIYSVLIKDANNDSLLVSDTLVAPNVFSTSITPSYDEQGYQFRCNHGEITRLDLQVAGGTPPYAYLWDTGKFSQDIDVYGAGTFHVSVTDNNGCEVKDSILLNAPEEIIIVSPELHMYPNGNIFSCDTCNDAQLTVGITGGVPPFTSILYTNSDTITGIPFTGLHADVPYTMRITDALGCIMEYEDSEVALPRITEIGVTAELSSYPGGYNISSNGGTDGSIQLNITGVLSQPTITWSDTVFANITDAYFRTGLSAGTYVVTVTGSLGSVTKTFTLTQPSNELIATISNTNGACNNYANFNVFVNGGVPPYNYQWFDASGAVGDGWSYYGTSNVGDYSVLVIDANNDSTEAFIGFYPRAIYMQANLVEVGEDAHVSCNGSDGSVELRVFGGVGPFQYRLLEAVSDAAQRLDTMVISMDTTLLFENLSAGNYTASIQEVNNAGCNVSESIELIESELDFGIEPHVYPNGQAFSCDTCNDGIFTIDTIFGGTPPYQVLWSTGETSYVLSGAYPDSLYTITVTDANGCTLTDVGSLPRGDLETMFNLDVSATLSQYPGGYNIGCFGCNNGSIELHINGGIPPYQIVWTTGDSLPILDSLMAGEYSVYVTDEMGNEFEKTYTLSQPQSGPLAMLNGTYSSCTSTGNITAMVNGGTPPYTYHWFGPSGALPTQHWESLGVSEEGLYALWVKDANNDSTYTEIYLSPSLPLNPTVTSPFIHANANAGCTGEDGSIVISIEGGVPPFNVSVVEFDPNSDGQTLNILPQASQSPSNNSPGLSTGRPIGISVTSYDTLIVIDSLSAGQYDVSISDNSGCGLLIGNNHRIELVSPPPLLVNVIPTEQPNGYYLSCDTCNDGTANLQVTGAYGSVQYAWLQVPSETATTRIKGASLFEQITDDDINPSELFGGNLSFVIGSTTQQTGFNAEVMYAGFAMDELGCFGGEAFMLEKPKAGSGPDPDWKLNGNSGLDPNGQQRWLGTNDSTDFVMKSNGEPQLRLGSDGVTQIYQDLKISGLEDVESGLLMVGADGKLQRLTGDEYGYLNDTIVHLQQDSADLTIMANVEPTMFLRRPSPFGGSRGNNCAPADPESKWDRLPISFSDGPDLVRCEVGGVGIGHNTYENYLGDILPVPPRARLDIHAAQSGSRAATSSIFLSRGDWPSTSYQMRISGNTAQKRIFEINPHVIANGFAGTLTGIILQEDGKVGIGERVPKAKLDVAGQAHARTLSVNTYDNVGRLTVRASNDDDAVIFQDIDGATSLTADRNGKIIIGEGYFNQSLDTASIYLGDVNHSISSVFGKGLSFSTYNAEDALVVHQNSGKVSIGNVTPPNNNSIYKLYVEGGITTRDVMVTSGSFPDYVFKADYSLPTIYQLANYIEKHGHLPDIPSESDVIANGGYELGNLQLLLLRKIEEQTLYIIEMQKQIDELKVKTNAK